MREIEREFIEEEKWGDKERVGERRGERLRKGKKGGDKGS